MKHKNGPRDNGEEENDDDDQQQGGGARLKIPMVS